MSKTTLIWLCIYFSGIIGSFIKGPIYALLTYMFTFYTQFSWAGRIKQNRWSFYVAIALLFSYLLTKNRQAKLSYFKIPQFKWLILFTINMLLVTPFAVRPAYNSNTLLDFVKITLLYYLIVSVITNKKYYKMFLWVQLWGNYLFSWQGFHKGTTRGRLEGVGGPATNTSNGLANHLVTILPFINNFVFYGSKWEKIAAIYAAPWILNAIILCNSRGAFLGIIAIGILSLVRASKRIRKKMIIGMVLGGILFFQLADQRFWDRMGTMSNPEDEGSASSRLETWSAAIRLIQDHPFGTGGGGWLYYSHEYIPDIVYAHKGQVRSVHNSYLEVATNYGIQGILIYVLFISSTILELRRIRMRTGTDDDVFYHVESTAIELAIWGFLITAFFGARPYLETLYWFSALGCALSNIQQSELKDKTECNE